LWFLLLLLLVVVLRLLDDAFGVGVGVKAITLDDGSSKTVAANKRVPRAMDVVAFERDLDAICERPSQEPLPLLLLLLLLLYRFDIVLFVLVVIVLFLVSI